MEYALIQSLELRAYDAVLDEEILKAYGDRCSRESEGYILEDERRRVAVDETALGHKQRA